MNLKNPASDLATAWNGTTIGGVTLVIGSNMFPRRIHPRPMGLVVELLNTGGQPPEPFLSPTAAAYFQAGLQLLIWGMPGEDGFEAGETFALALLGAAQQLIPSGYISFLADISAPLYVGPDPDTQRHGWSINLTVRYRT